jgi:hypothetical protein
VTSTSAWATARAFGERGHLEGAHRAVPEDRARVGELLGIQLRRGRADVQAHHVGGDGVGGHGDGLGVGGELAPHDDVDGQHDLDAGLLRATQVVPTRVDAVGVEQALADLVALGREEGEEHAAPDEEAVGGVHEVVDDGELVGDLGAAEHDGIRALGVDGQALEDVDLGGDEATHGGRQSRGDVVDRCLLAVHDAETVGDVGVGQGGEGVGELGTLLVDLGGLPRVEPQVLEQGDVAVGQRVDGRAALSPTVSVAKATGRPSSSESRPTTGAREYLSSGAPLGRPRWAHTMTRAPASARALMVGTEARMRPSSVIVVPSSGTLRSERTRTRLPRRSPNDERSPMIDSAPRSQRLLPTRSVRSMRRLE